MSIIGEQFTINGDLLGTTITLIKGLQIVKYNGCFYA